MPELKIVIGVNTLNAVNHLAYANHCQFWYRLGRDHSDKKFIFNAPHRMSIDRMRNMTARIALDANADYLMFIDDDVIVPMDTLDRLLAADRDIVSGWTVIRGYPFNNMFFKYMDGDHKDLTYLNDIDTSSGAIIPTDAVGFSCVLIKVSLLRRIPQPYFVTGSHNTEDVYFCIKAREYVKDCTIETDVLLETGHIMDAEVVEPRNKHLFAKFYEECWKYEKETTTGEDRADEYLQRVKETVGEGT